jgi:hypothetical protein
MQAWTTASAVWIAPTKRWHCCRCDDYPNFGCLVVVAVVVVVVVAVW